MVDLYLDLIIDQMAISLKWYINEEDQEYNTPKLFSEFEVKGKYNELLLKKIPKCCEIVKVEIKEVKDDGTQKSADD